MSIRISTAASQASLVNMMLKQQTKLYDLQTQLGTEKVSQTYIGVSAKTATLLSLESEQSRNDNFLDTNNSLSQRMSVADSAMQGIYDTADEFYSQLISFGADETKTESEIADIQELAYQALAQIEEFLNAEYNGDYLFGGATEDEVPVDLGLGDNLDDFQATYDGESVIVPLTYEASTADFTTDTADTGDLTLTGTTITAATTGSLSGIPVGSTITLSGSSADDGTYTVVSNDGTTITISGTIGTTGETVTASMTGGETVSATLSATSYYQGDNLSQSYRLDSSKTVEYDVTADDPAIEKIIRGLKIIAQGGDYGDAGSLDQNMDRVDAASWLIGSGLGNDMADPAPYGTEDGSGVPDLQVDISRVYTRAQNAIEDIETYQLYVENAIGDIENIDTTEVAALLNSQTTALETSYAALSQLQGLSLLNYL